MLPHTHAFGSSCHQVSQLFQERDSMKTNQRLTNSTRYHKVIKVGDRIRRVEAWNAFKNEKNHRCDECCFWSEQLMLIFLPGRFHFRATDF